MKTNIIRTVILSLLISYAGISFAQTSTQTTGQSNKWIEKVRSFKLDLLIQEAEMSPEQKEQFTPLYTEMENQIYQANREARNIEQEISRAQENVNDEQYSNAAFMLSQVKTKEAEIENHYFSLFSKILSKKQMFLLKRAENRFTIKMLNHNKRSKKISKEQNN